MRKIPIGVTLGVAAAGVLVAVPLVTAEPEKVSLSSGEDTPPTEDFGADIDWEPCEANKEVECGSVEVPLDWERPDGETIDISVSRVPAENPDERIGNLVYLAGGPGDPGAMALVHSDIGQYFTEDVMERFDIVGFDPRGVGNSSPLECSEELLDEEPDSYLENQQDFEERVAYNEELYADCRERSGDKLYDNVDTQSVVHDLDAIRASLGEEKLTSVGASYGTAIGQQYAEDYPDKIRALALDSNVDHSAGTEEWVNLKAEMSQDAFEMFVDWCESDERCELDGGDVREKWHDLLDRAEAGEFPHPDKPDQALRRYDLIKSAYDCSHGPSWSELSGFLDSLEQGKTAELEELPCVSELPEGYPDSRGLNMVNFCSDYSLPVRNYGEWKSLVQRAGKRHAPDVEVNPNAIDRIADCLGYPEDIPNPQHELDVDGSEPLLLVNPLGDPITGHNQAVKANEQIGEESVLATYEGAGHAAYGTARGSECMNEIVADYLINGEAPRDGTRCPAVPYEPPEE